MLTKDDVIEQWNLAGDDILDIFDCIADKDILEKICSIIDNRFSILLNKV